VKLIEFEEKRNNPRNAVEWRLRTRGPEELIPARNQDAIPD
jgi:hypothetical protein